MITITNAKDAQERGSKCGINHFIPLDSGPVGPGEFVRCEDKNSEGDEELPLGRIVDLKPRYFVERAELDDVVSEDNEQEMMILIQSYENGGESRPDSTKYSNIPRSMTEVVETLSLDWIPSASAKTLAFVFHIDDVQEGVFSGQGMQDAFFVRHTRDAEKNNIPLDRKTFEWRLNPRKKYYATTFSERVWSAHATSTDHVFRSLHTKSAWDGRTKSVSLHGLTEEHPSCITCKMKKKFKCCDPLTMSLNQSREKKTLLNDCSARHTTDSKKSQSLRIQDQAELEAFRKVGTLQAALLFWKDLTGELKKWGFEMNPCDECAANKMIDGKQCTILWHVDDLKISHVDPKVVDGIIRKLNKKYGEIAPVTETRGKKHAHLGMDIDFSQPGKVIISMDGYVEEIIDEARKDMEGTVTSPAAEHLFKINPEPTPLGEDDKQHFHTMVAKLLFLCKRARPDLQEAVAFLTTRVKAPDQDDYKKLARVIRCLRAEPKLPLTLEADNAHMVKWWVDAAFAVHEDMRSHTGGTMTLGKGSVYSTSIRQKLNTTSSTEAELVGVADVMPMALWTRCFLEAQGFQVNKNYLYQDNQSAMLLEKNGKGSSGKRTRHINIRCFFVTDRINSGEVDVECCPTGEMAADYFTKPLQGAPFRKFRDAIMNIQK